jgi:hypothetical protein
MSKRIGDFDVELLGYRIILTDCEVAIESIENELPTCIISGDELEEIFQYAKENGGLK